MQPRPAATVVLARDSARGVEVLVLIRTPRARFLPGFAVFPGGVVDPGDEALAVSLFGDAAQAARACALRELYEEAGIVLAPDGARAAEPDRRFEDLGVSAPPVDAMPEIAHWVAPEFLETRFDARFFAAEAPGGVDPVPDGREITDARWERPDRVLDAAARGAAELMWPTLVTLRALATCRDVRDVLALHVEQVERPEAAR